MSNMFVVMGMDLILSRWKENPSLPRRDYPTTAQAQRDDPEYARPYTDQEIGRFKSILRKLGPGRLRQIFPEEKAAWQARQNEQMTWIESNWLVLASRAWRECEITGPGELLVVPSEIQGGFPDCEMILDGQRVYYNPGMLDQRVPEYEPDKSVCFSFVVRDPDGYGYFDEALCVSLDPPPPSAGRLLQSRKRPQDRKTEE